VIPIEKVKSVFFIGIGGIGMSALARYLNTKNIKVSGYDKTETQLTKKLVSEGIDIHYQDEIENIPTDIDLVVYTPAIPKNHKQFNYLLDSGIPVVKRAKLLGLMTERHKLIAVAGTHGKTTTSAMVSYLAIQCDIKVTAFLGGIAHAFDSNFIDGDSEWMVAEADEYDRSFLSLIPVISVVNSVDADHLDIYGTESAILESFAEFMCRTKPGGHLIIPSEVERKLTPEIREKLSAKKVKVVSFGSENSEVIYSNVGVEGASYTFDYEYEGFKLQHLKLGMPGIHNLKNMVAAITAVLLTGSASIARIPDAVSAFSGIKRRFELVWDGKIKYIDDYAHHPTELEATISSAKMMYPEKKVLGVFQPHLFSRTRDFYKGFAEALDELDEVILLPIYPARELPMEGVESEMIAGEMKNENVKVVPFDKLIEELKNRKFDVLLTLGAGDIDLHVNEIKAWLKYEQY